MIDAVCWLAYQLMNVVRGEAVESKESDVIVNMIGVEVSEVRMRSNQRHDSLFGECTPDLENPLDLLDFSLHVA